MIKGIISDSRHLVVNGASSSMPYVPMNSNNPIQGMLRVNGQDMQVFDGSSWITMGGTYATVDLSADAQSLLEWARVARDKEMLRESRIAQSPALKKAYEAIKRAEENFDILDKIIGDDI